MTTTVPPPRLASGRPAAAPPRRGPAATATSTGRGSRLRLPGVATGNYYLLLVVVVVINMIGLIMVLSSSAVKALAEGRSTWYYFERQALWTVFGSIALVALMVFGHRLRRFSFALMVVAAGLLLLVLVPGIGLKVNGARRWIGAGSMQFQPSELAKLVMVLFVANLVDRRQHHLEDRWMAARCVVRPVMVALAVVAGLIMVEPNLGTTLIIAAISFAMLFIAGAPGKPLVRWLLLGVGGAVAAVVLSPWRFSRLMAFRDPWAHEGKAGFQTLQSQAAAAGGGILGPGHGDSRAKWNYLPEAHTDFIYAVMAEELGLLGGLLVIMLFLGIAVLGARIALKAGTRHDQMLAVGVTAWLVTQAFVNVGAVVGVLPVTGVPLPFISFGGSSLLFTLAGAGLLLGVARRPAPDRAERPPSPGRVGTGPAAAPRRGAARTR